MNLGVAWFDCQETFESVPHSWEEKSIEMVGVNNKIVNYQYRKGEMEYKASFRNKTASNAKATHSDTKRNIPGGLSFAITLLYST
jgi:hypothetical protein